MKNYYTILGIAENATEDEIYMAYKNKIIQFNGLPFHTNQMIQTIKLLKECIYVLGHTIKRQKYDDKLRLRQKIQKEYTNTSRHVDGTKICDRIFSLTFG